MTEWKMSELESVKELTDSDLEKTVGGSGNILITGGFDLFGFLRERTKNHI